MRLGVTRQRASGPRERFLSDSSLPRNRRRAFSTLRSARTYRAIYSRPAIASRSRHPGDGRGRRADRVQEVAQNRLDRAAELPGSRSPARFHHAGQGERPDPRQASTLGAVHPWSSTEGDEAAESAARALRQVMSFCIRAITR